MHFILLIVLLGGTATPAPAQDLKGQQPQTSSAASPSATLSTDDEKAIYAVGLSIWRSLAPLDLSPAEIEILKRALSDAAEGKVAISLQEAAPKVQALSRARVQRAIEKEKARSVAYFEKAEREPGAVKFASGLVFFDTQPGEGDVPQAGDTVRAHYRGTLADGTEFDDSRKRGEPAEFQLNHVIRCWTEGLQKMKVGGKARLLCPASIAYGDRGVSSKIPGQPSIPGGAALAFEVELIEIVRAPASPVAPKPPSQPR